MDIAHPRSVCRSPACRRRHFSVCAHAGQHDPAIRRCARSAAHSSADPSAEAA